MKVCSKAGAHPRTKDELLHGLWAIGTHPNQLEIATEQEGETALRCF